MVPEKASVALSHSIPLLYCSAGIRCRYLLEIPEPRKLKTQFNVVSTEKCRTLSQHSIFYQPTSIIQRQNGIIEPMPKVVSQRPMSSTTTIVTRCAGDAFLVRFYMAY